MGRRVSDDGPSKIERRRRDPAEQWTQWAREAATIIAAACAAYMGIRVDLTRHGADIEQLRAQTARIEAQVEKLREARERTAH